MTHHEKVCWNCGSKAVFPIETWFECQDCGATHVPPVTLGPLIVEPGNVWRKGDTDRPTRQAMHPTPAAARQARLARQAKV